MKIKIQKGLPEDGLRIRETVFVREQGFTDEVDEADAAAFHLVLYNEEGEPVATGRVFPGDDRAYMIGRLAVLKEYRGLGLGQLSLEALERKALEEGAERTVLSSQCHAMGFYEKCGYTGSGDIYYEQACPHIHMEKPLAKI